MKFVSIDVETANADMASICSIGLVEFDGNQSTSEWYSLIDPRAHFDGINISIHGINETMVANAPTYAEVAANIEQLTRDAIVVTHTHFDRVAMHQAARRWTVDPPNCTWLDTARVARRAWSDCAQSGYGLSDLCQRIGYEFQHHHALEDAKAAGHVLLAAMIETGLDIEGMLHRVGQPLGSNSGALRRDGNPEGPLFGEVVAFTGTLTIVRSEAADLAASLGCHVGAGVTKDTTLLVVGDTDVMRLAGHVKSSKHRKAEKLIAQGFPIRIIRETDFRDIVATA